MAGVLLKCGDCGALLKFVQEAQEHAKLTSHSNFSESTEAILNLVCISCGKPCRSKTESDLHTKIIAHTEFVDKTSEAAKPISLEVPKVVNDSGEAMDVDASCSSKPVGTVLASALPSLQCSLRKDSGRMILLFVYLSVLGAFNDLLYQPIAERFYYLFVFN